MREISERKRLSSGIRTSVAINLMAIIFLSAVSIVPILDRDTPQAIRFGLFLLWVVSSLSVARLDTGDRGFKLMQWWTIYLLLQLSYSVVGYSREPTFFLARCYLYVMPIVMVYITRFFSLKEIKILWLAFVAIFAASLIYNFMLPPMSEDEEAFYVTSADRGSNAGGTTFVVDNLFLIPIFWIVFKVGIKKFWRVFSLAAMGLCGVYMIFWNNRATALVILIIMAVYMIIVESRNYTIRHRKTQSIVTIVIVAVAGFFAFVPILNFLSEYFSEMSRLSERLQDLAYVMQNGGVGDLQGGSLFYRVLLWQTSIQTFFGGIVNFLFGIGERTTGSMDIFELVKTGVGCHSELFDLAARYGLLGILIFVQVMRATYSYLLNISDDEHTRDRVRVIISGIFIQMTVNNISPTGTMSVIFIFLPATLMLLKYKKI